MHPNCGASSTAKLILFVGEDNEHMDDVEDTASPLPQAPAPYVADRPVESMPVIGPPPRSGEVPPGFAPCKCMRLHGGELCLVLTDRSSGLCELCEDDDSSSDIRCNYLCEGCDLAEARTLAIVGDKRVHGVTPDEMPAQGVDMTPCSSESEPCVMGAQGTPPLSPHDRAANIRRFPLPSLEDHFVSPLRAQRNDGITLNELFVHAHKSGARGRHDTLAAAAIASSTTFVDRGTDTTTPEHARQLRGVPNVRDSTLVLESPPPSPPSSMSAYVSPATPGAQAESMCNRLTSVYGYIKRRVSRWLSTEAQQRTTASSPSLASASSSDARRASPPSTQPVTPPPPTLQIGAFACSWGDSNPNAGQTPSLDGTRPRLTPPGAAQTTPNPHTNMTWLIDGLPAQLSFPHSRVSSPSKMDPFGLRSDPNPNWLPDTTPTPPSPPPSSSEFDEYVYFQPETRADDLHDVRSVRLAGWWLLCYPEAGGVVWYGVEHHAEDGPPFVITHVQDIYTVLRDRLEWLLYRPLYQLRGADLSLASYELRGANLSLASYDEPCSWRAFANYSHIAAPNRWPHLHTWPEYDRWTPFYYRDHGVFVPRPVTLLERIRYWWLDVYHPHCSQSYDGSTWWCFRCHLPDDAARLHAASLQCRTDESHRYAMLNTIGGLGHLAGNFADLLLLQRALRDVEQRRLYRWVPPTLPDDTSDEFRAATWSEFSIDAYLADARSGFGEWPTPSDWSPFFVHARSGYAPSPPDWPEPLSTPAASPSQSPPSSPPPPSPPPSPSSLLPSSPSYSPSPPHSPLPPHRLQSRHQAPPSHTPSPPPSPMSQPLCQHHRHSLPILASEAYQVVVTRALVIMAKNTLTLHPPVMSGHVGWFVYTAQREYIHANIRHYHCTTNSLAQWMWHSWRSLMVASSIAVLCRQTADAKDKQLTSIAEGVKDYHDKMHERRTRDGETLALPPAMPAPSDITHELYDFTLSSGTRQSRFGLTLPVTFTSLAGGLSSLEHEPFAPLRLSFDMLYDLDLHAPDFHYGHILKRFGMVLQLSMRVILRFLHIRAAFMGFSVSTRRGEYVEYGYNGSFTIPFARTTLICNKGPQRRTYTQESSK